MVSIFSTQESRRDNLNQQASKSNVQAAKYAEAGQASKSQQASDVAAKANVASAQMSQQIAESNK